MNATETKKIRDRSVAYPSVTVQQAIEIADELLKGLGKGPYSREEAAKAIGHTALTGAASRKIAALVQYGLLIRIGNTYSQTQLAQDILIPIDEKQKRAAIIQSVRNPKLFASLIERYQEQALPNMLESILVREKINHSVAAEVASTFRESLEYAGVLQNGVILKHTDTEGDRIASNTEPEQIIGKAQNGDNVGAGSQPGTLGAHAFKFTGGVTLLIPSSPAVDDAILDGALKEIRKGLKDFANHHFGDPESKEDGTN